MKGLDYEILICDIKILNIKLQKLHIQGSKLLLEKPPFFLVNRKKNWQKKLNEMFEQEIDIHNKLIDKYKQMEQFAKK